MTSFIRVPHFLSENQNIKVLCPLINRGVTNIDGMDHSVLRREVSAVLHDRYVCVGGRGCGKMVELNKLMLLSDCQLLLASSLPFGGKYILSISITFLFKST